MITFLRDLGQRARPYAEKDVADMRAFAAEQLGIADPQAWDWSYIGEKLKEERYAFSEQEVKQYFTAPKVLAGLFKIVETLFEVTIRRDVAPVWNPGVEFYRIERERREGERMATELVGQFYLDPPRAPASAAAPGWTMCARAGCAPTTAGCRRRWRTWSATSPKAWTASRRCSRTTTSPPCSTSSATACTTCSRSVNERDVSGISGVEWDAVELPSQFMENFCWEWDVLRHMTAHVETGAPLPRELFDKMLAAKNFQSGLQTLRQIEFALFDMLLHTEHDPAQDFMPLLDQVRDEVAVLQPPAFSRTAHTFSHIFAGGYAAGYYSYKWAEVLSADAYAAFEETSGKNGLPSIETGRKYRQAILEAGGSRPAIESFKAFRGREPTLDALLRHQGMA